MEVVNAIPGTNGMIEPMITLSCRIGRPRFKANKLRVVTMALPKILMINFELLLFRLVRRKNSNTTPKKKATIPSAKVPPNK